MKIKLYILGLLLVSSFNVLGVECKTEEGEKIISSIYSSKEDGEDVCICKAGYEFNPYISTGKLLSQNGNSFADPSIEEKKWQCIIPKDNTKLSTITWALPTAIFALVTGTLSSYSFYRFKKSNNSTLVDEDIQSDQIEHNNSEEDPYDTINDGDAQLDMDFYDTIKFYPKNIVGQSRENLANVSIDTRPPEPLPKLTKPNDIFASIDTKISTNELDLLMENIQKEIDKGSIDKKTLTDELDLLMENIQKEIDKFPKANEKEITGSDNFLPENTTADPNLDAFPDSLKEYDEISKDSDSLSRKSEECN